MGTTVSGKRRWVTGWPASLAIAVAILVLLFIGSAFSPTLLITPVAPGLLWPVCIFSTVVGVLLGLKTPVRPEVGETRRRVFLTVVAVVYAVSFAALGTGIARYVAELYSFRRGAEQMWQQTLPIELVGKGKGGTQYAYVDGIKDRLDISRGDYAILTDKMAATRSTRYCLRITFERAGNAVRIRVPRAPRPSRSRRTITIVPCQSGWPSPRILS